MSHDEGSSPRRNSGYRPGFGLPASVLFDLDHHQRLLANRWFFVATRADVLAAGDIFEFQLFDQSFLLIHGQDGVIRGFENRCAHQSARLVAGPTSSCGRRLVCPNHRWSYDPDAGTVVGTPGFPADLIDDPDVTSQLASIAVAERSGLLFATLGEPDIADLDAMAAVFSPYTDAFHVGAGGYQVALHEREVVDANWLLVMINNRECVHCRTNHPGLCEVFDPASFNGATSASYQALLDAAADRWTTNGLPWKEQAFDVHDAVRVARYPMREGFASITFDGAPACAKTIGPWDHHDASTLSIWLNPNAWLHFTSDHIATNWVLPIDAHRCALYTSWIVAEESESGVDFDLDHLADVWRVTNAEDVVLCNSMTAGARSPNYRPGPFAADERWCRQFCDWIMANSGSDSSLV